MVNNDINIFNNEILSSLIFHIPHSSTSIPDYTGFDISKIDNEIKLLTDFNTDQIFNVPNTSKLIFPYNRIFCDVERLIDKDEIMFNKGRGFFYTNCDNGEILRKDKDGIKNIIYNKYYKKHHKKLEKMVEHKLNTIGYVTIIDCHSFSDKPFITDLIKNTNRPDICIGVDKYHTPKFLIEIIENKCKDYGFTYKINDPYSGTIVPLKYYEKNNNVNSIMIEINRNLYMNGDDVNYESISFLNGFINSMFGL